MWHHPHTRTSSPFEGPYSRLGGNGCLKLELDIFLCCAAPW